MRVKVCFVATLAVCLLLVSASAQELEPSPEFRQAEELVFAQWKNFAGFRNTQKALKKMLSELSASPADERDESTKRYIKDLSELIGFFEFDVNKCDVVRDEIALALRRFTQYDANLTPYLKTIRSRQRGFCDDPRPENRGGSPNYITVANHDNYLMSAIRDLEFPENDDNCTAKCLGEELDLDALKMDETEQMRLVISSKTFKKALRIVYGFCEETIYRLFFPRAVRQALKELADVEKQYKKLDKPLALLKSDLSALLEVCTPEASKCDYVFGRFSKVFPQAYEQLNRRANLRQFAKECLLSINRFCSFFD